jgi:poly-beta-1,6-N-acetyl-D-glucosamine synthase
LSSHHAVLPRLACEEDTEPTITFAAIPDEMPTMVIPAMREAAYAPPRVIAILPAHNEGETVADTIAALQGQSRPPDEIYVFTDNCTDTLMAWHAFRQLAEKAHAEGDENALAQFEKDHGASPPPEGGRTATAAFGMGVSVVSTVGNKDMKAGNLNRAFSLLMPGLRDIDVIMNFDADSVPGRHFVRNALRWLSKGYGAVGATFHGRDGGRLLGLLQRAEFARLAQHQHRKLRCDVLSGTGAAFPVAVLRAVAASRPDNQVYDIRHITEDFELTLRVRQLGINAVSPADCRVTTDVMTTYRSWWTQRLRWQLGTLFALKEYGWARDTRDIIIRQILIYLVMIATPLTVVYLAWSFALFGWAGINPLNAPLYLAGILLVLCEQAWQARKAGLRAMLSTLVIVPDLFYSLVRQVVYLRALWRLARNQSADWGAGTEITSEDDKPELVK